MLEHTHKRGHLAYILHLIFFRLQPRFIISGLIPFTRLHHELAGVQEPEPLASPPAHTNAASAIDASILDPRRSRNRANLPACPPFVSIDRLREWIVPNGSNNAENEVTPVIGATSESASKAGRFAGYRGNYFLLSLPDPATQKMEVSKLCETLRSRQLVSFPRFIFLIHVFLKRYPYTKC